MVLAWLPEVVASMASNESAHGGSGRKLNIVVEGCCHGELPKIYASVVKMEQVNFVIFHIFFLADLNGDTGTRSISMLTALCPKRGAVEVPLAPNCCCQVYVEGCCSLLLLS